jgi:hypothetical protein
MRVCLPKSSLICRSRGAAGFLDCLLVPIDRARAGRLLVSNVRTPELWLLPINTDSTVGIIVTKKKKKLLYDGTPRGCKLSRTRAAPRAVLNTIVQRLKQGVHKVHSYDLLLLFQ